MPRLIRITAVPFLLALFLGSVGTVRAVPVYVDSDWETGGGSSSGLMARLARAANRSGDKSSNCVPVPAAGKAAEEVKGATERTSQTTKNCPSAEPAGKSDPNRAPKPMLRLP